MLIAQLTDTHVSTPGSVIDRLFRTAEHLGRALAHLGRMTPSPDIVLVTGDLVEHGTLEEYRRFRSLLDQLPMPVYVIPGNHDSRDTMRQAFADRGYLPQEGQFLHYTVEDWPVRLVALDTHVPGRPEGRLCAERLAWLDARLREAPARPTLLLMHHPPFATGIRALDSMSFQGRDRFAELVGRHQQIERIVCGHVHRAMTRRFAGTVAITCPSTAHQLVLDLAPTNRLAVTMEPAACALHLWQGAEAGLVSHLSPIGTERASLIVFDGVRWLEDPVPPAGFHGE